MRDRLIELLKDFCSCRNEDCSKCGTQGKCFTHRKADYLLKNGVIVPPCEVGDVVYSIRGFDGKTEQCEPYTVEDITIFKNTITIHIRDEWLFVRNMYPDDFGKTVFYTKEEAEQALEGGAQ